MNNFEDLEPLLKNLSDVHKGLMNRYDDMKKHLTKEQKKDLDKKMKEANKSFKDGNSQLSDLIKKHI